MIAQKNVDHCGGHKPHNVGGFHAGGGHHDKFQLHSEVALNKINTMGFRVNMVNNNISLCNYCYYSDVQIHVLLENL